MGGEERSGQRRGHWCGKSQEPVRATLRKEGPWPVSGPLQRELEETSLSGLLVCEFARSLQEAGFPALGAGGGARGREASLAQAPLPCPQLGWQGLDPRTNPVIGHWAQQPPALPWGHTLQSVNL